MSAPSDVTTLEGLTAALKGKLQHQAGRVNGQIGTVDGTYCSRCGDVRRMTLRALYWEDMWVEVNPFREGGTVQAVPNLRPSLFQLECLQCEGRIALLVHQGPAGIELVALPDSYAGLPTPYTPEPVAFYLDQAQRAQAVGARSAAAAMYRSALEHLLHEQGYEGMLNAKIKSLESDPTPPAWLSNLDPAYLRVIKDLGNGAIHTNGGDLTKQATFDAGLLIEVRELFAELLDQIYEQPAVTAARLARLQQAATAVDG